VEELLAKAEASDSEGGQEDGQSLPQEIARRERLRQRMAEARRQLEQRAQQQAAEGERQSESEDKGSKSARGSKGKPKDSDQINLTDAESALMRKSRRDGYEQAYNAQAVVDAEGSQLILAVDVIRTPSDANQLKPAVKSVPQELGGVDRVLADGGYVNAQVFEELEDQVELYVAVAGEDNNYRRYDYRPPKKRTEKKVKDPRLVAMRDKVRSQEGRRIYRKRASTVEPVFGTIKSTMGLRQFLLRGLEKVRIEWELAALAYNLRRLWVLKTAAGT
jgi:hypothetical protein